MSRTSEPDGDDAALPDDPLVESGSAHAFDPANRMSSDPGPPPSSTQPVWIVVELPEEELGGAFATRLGRAGFKSQIHHPGIFVRHAVVEAEPLAAMMEDLVGRSLTGAKMTVLNGLGEPSLTEILTQLMPMGAFVERLKAQWLMPFIVSRGVFAMLQPVFTSSGETWGFDALVRLAAPGGRMLGEEIVRAAQELDLAQLLDRLARLDAFATLSAVAAPNVGKLVLHASQATFAGLGPLQRSLVELTRAHGIGLDRVVVNAPWASCEDAVAVGTAFHALRGLGVTLSVRGGPRAPEILTPSDIVSLVRELDAAVVRVPADATDDALAAVAERLRGSGVLVHATHVGDARRAAAARACGAELFSGLHFGAAGNAPPG
jgi:hypothetical protein